MIYNLIGIKVDREESTIYDILYNFIFELDNINKKVKVYHNNKYIGYLSNVVGVDEEDLIREANIRK